MARLNSLIAETVAELLHRKSKDPRLSMVTVTRAEVAPDLRSARIHYGVLDGDEAAREAAGRALEKARGFLRSALYERLSIRRIPELRFEPDRNAAYAASMSALLAELAPPEPPAETAAGTADAAAGGDSAGRDGHDVSEAGGDFSEPGGDSSGRDGDDASGGDGDGPSKGLIP